MSPTLIQKSNVHVRAHKSLHVMRLIQNAISLRMINKARALLRRLFTLNTFHCPILSTELLITMPIGESRMHAFIIVKLKRRHWQGPDFFLLRSMANSLSLYQARQKTVTTWCTAVQVSFHASGAASTPDCTHCVSTY